MSPAERRARIVALLAHIDQLITESRALALDESLTSEERNRADASLMFYESAAKHTEILLRNSGTTHTHKDTPF